jgi:diketogulonate reductase-like aldo/keto reductase
VLARRASLARMGLSFVDLSLVHNPIVAKAAPGATWATPVDLFTESVRSALEDLVRRGRIGAWGITAIAEPDELIRVFGEQPAPAAAHCVTNLLDSIGGWRQPTPVTVPGMSSPRPATTGSA